MAIRYPESEPAVRTVKHKLDGGTAATTAVHHGGHQPLSAKEVRKLSMFSSALVKPAIVDSFRKLSPRAQAKNPVMFVTLIGAFLTTAGVVTATTARGFVAQLALWLWFIFGRRKVRIAIVFFYLRRFKREHLGRLGVFDSGCLQLVIVLL